MGATNSSDDTSAVTVMGRFLSSFPGDLAAGKLVAFGCALGVPAEAVIMAAALSTGDVFIMPHALVAASLQDYGDTVRRVVHGRWLLGIDSVVGRDGGAADLPPRGADGGSSAAGAVHEATSPVAPVRILAPGSLLATKAIEAAARTGDDGAEAKARTVAGSAGGAGGSASGGAGGSGGGKVSGKKAAAAVAAAAAAAASYRVTPLAGSGVNCCSDAITVRNAYIIWRAVPEVLRNQWCFAHGINGRRMKTLHSLVREIAARAKQDLPPVY
jgi:HrpA-like RNA helicase